MLKLKEKTKKVILSILALLILSFSFAPSALAQGGTWYNQSFDEWSSKVFDQSNPQEIFGERYTFAQVQWISYSLASLVIGTNILECAGLAAQNVLDQFKACVEGLTPVASGSESRSFAYIGGPLTDLALLSDTLLATRPASGIEYLASSASKLHLIPEANAQVGFGFQSLSPVLKIWRAFRNIAYLLSILVVLAMAFMIMFRVKISPQAVISVQSALPKVVMTLILITFSYAIAGFLIDISYLILAIIAGLVKSQGLAGNLTPPLGPLELAQRMWGSAAWPIASLIIMVTIPIVILVIGGGLIAGALGGSVTIPVLGPAGTISGAWLGGLFGIIILLLIGIFILYTLVKILWTMLKSFINILLLTIFGPLILLLGAVSPGSGGFGTWFRNLAANVAVFPTIGVLAFMAHLLFWSGDNFFLNLFRESGFLNPFAIGGSIGQGGFQLPLFSTGTFLAPVLAGLGILFIIPSAAQLIKSMVEGKPFTYGTAIGEAFGPVGAAGRAGALFGAGYAFDRAERGAWDIAKQTPWYVQAGRRVLNIRPGAPPPPVSPRPEKK